MLSWFSNKRPLGLADKAHIELRFGWLAKQIGWQPLLESETWTPLKFSRFDSGISEADAAEFVNAVAAALPDNNSEFQIVALPQSLMPGGEEEGMEFCFERQSVDPVSVATIKVSRNVMLDRGITMAALVRIVVNEHIGRKHGGFTQCVDFELIHALFAVFHGFGIICANGTLKMVTETYEQMHYSRVRTVGSIPAQYYGYALALKCWLTGNDAGESVKLLRPDAGVMLKKSLKYLNATGDATIGPEDVQNGSFGYKAEASARDLRSSSAQVRLLALWEVEDKGLFADEEVMVAVTESLQHDEPDVSAVAKHVLAMTRVFPPQVVDCLLLFLDQRDDLFCNTAARLLAAEGLHFDYVLDHLRFLFRRRRRTEAIDIMRLLVQKNGMPPELESLVPEFISAAGWLVTAGDPQIIFTLLNPVLSRMENLLELIRSHSPGSSEIEVEQLVQIAFGQDPFQFDEPDFGNDRFVIR